MNETEDTEIRRGALLMWPYHNVSREEFENKKDAVDKILRDLGCEVIYMELPYEQKTTSYGAGFKFKETWTSRRPVYQYEGRYYRIDEVLFDKKPFIVLETAGTMEEVMEYRMEDADPFPYDLSEEELVKEMKYSLRIEPYPIP